MKTPHTPNLDGTKLALILCGTFSFLIGLIVVVGWHTNNVALLRIIPVSVPMAYNTAIGFILCGLAIISLSFGSRLFPLLSALYSIPIGSLILIQYLSGIDFGIDGIIANLIFPQYSGPMAPNTAFCFVMIGLSFVFMSSRRPSRLGLCVVGIAGFTLATLGLFSLLGYLSNLPKVYTWGLYTPMAVHTAAVWLALGGAVLVYLFKIINAVNFVRRGVIVFAFVLSLVITTSIVIASSGIFFSLINNAREIVNTHEIQEKINKIFLILREAETGRRNYMIRQDEIFLEPFYTAQKDLLPLLDEYSELIRHRPQQHQRLENLKTLIVHKLSLLREAIELIKTQGVDRTFEDEKTLAGTEVTEQIRSLIEEIRHEEEQRFHHHYETLDNNARKSVFMMLAGIFLSVGLSIFVFYFLIREVREHRRAEAKYQALTETINECIFEIDSRGICTYIGPKIKDLIGYDPQELFDKQPFRVMAGPGADFKVFDVVLESQQAFSNMVYPARHKNGWPVTFEISGAPVFDGKGEFDGYRGIIHDITERRRFEEDRQKYQESLIQLTQQAKAASKAKSDFIAGMSHEFRTPLNSVLGFTQILSAEYYGPLNDKQKEYIRDISESGNHLLDLINDILDIAKIEAGSMELRPEPLKVKNLLSRVMVLFQEKAVTHGIALKLKISADFPEELLGDEVKLKQVLFNFLSNAFKFTPDGGRITIDARRNAGTEPEISVIDTGTGIKKEDQKKLFSPFTQLDPDKAGTGLGLSLCKNIVDLWGGTIGLVSPVAGQPGGCRFYFTIPDRKQKEP